MTNTETGIVKAVEASLWQREEAIRAILPNNMDMKRFVKTAMIALSKNKDLHECTQESIVRSIIEAAEAGLEPTGMLSRAWLVPYNNKGIKEAQLQIGYQGLADLMRRSGEVRKVITRVVYEGDEFRVIQGTEERVEHTPAYLTEDPLKITYFYCIVTYKDGTSQHEVMTKAQVDMVRSRAKGKNADAWTLSYPEMGRKTVERRASKWTPLTVEAIEAIAKDDEREYGAPTVAAAIGTRTSSLREAIKAQAEEIEGTAVEVPVESAEQPTETPGNGYTSPDNVTVAPPDNVTVATRTKCGSLSDPALGDIEECALAVGHLDVSGTKRQHRAPSGSIWPAVKKEAT